MTRRLPIRVSAAAAGQIREAASWWRQNRPSAPNAVREDLGRVLALVWPNGADFDPALLYHWPKIRRDLEELARSWQYSTV